MKVRGKSNLRRPSRRIRLDCGEEITVIAPPLGAPFRALEIVPPPEPPKRRVVTKQGVQFLSNEDDPAFKAAEARANELQLIYLFWEAVRDVPADEGVEFEARLGHGNTPDNEFVEKIAAELRASPLTQGDLLKVGRFVSESSGASEEEAESAVDFSAGPERQITG